MTDPLIYEDLVDAFEHSLLHQLRGHGAAVPYLDTWVPDPDPVRSLLNMLEAAEMAGETALRVSVGEATLPPDRHGEVLQMADEFGAGSIEPTAAGMILSVTGLGLSQHFRRVNPIYRTALKSRLGHLRHVGRATTAGSHTIVEAEADGFTLSVAVDPSTHIVEFACHDGPDEPVAGVVLDHLCDVIVGTPLQDIADHGVQHLMSRLADETTLRPVKGILLPQNADPIFTRPLQLTRRLLEAYRATTGYAGRDNEFSPVPSSDWSRLDPDAKQAAVVALLATACTALGLAQDAATLARIERNLLDREIRVVVEFSADVPAATKPDLARNLELQLKRVLEPQIELYSEELKDKNVIRRL